MNVTKKRMQTLEYEKQINENKSSCYPEMETYKQEVYSPYNQLWAN